MSAIHGVWRIDGDSAAAEADRQSRVLVKFGRDLGDVHHEGAVALGWRRACLLPEDRSTTRLPGPDRYVVVADVRLTERDDLARQLGVPDDGDPPSDAELVRAAIERWHEGAFDRLYGSFAVAAWDRQRQRLLLARDHAGEMPLFYHRSADRVVFASMPEGLRAIEGIARDIDAHQYARFLRGLYASPGKTMFDDIGRIMPGHYAVIDASGITEHRYWLPDLSPFPEMAQDEYVRLLDTHLQNAVAASLRGVASQVAAHLSAGFDSSTVAATAAMQLAGRGGKVVAFTAVPKTEVPDGAIYPGMLADESVIAAQTAALHPNIEHVVVPRDRDPLLDLDRVSTIFPEPPSGLINMTWTIAINDRIRDRGLKVLLHAFRGNATISESGVWALPELVRRGRIATWWPIARGLVRRGTMRWRGVIWNSIEPLLPDALHRRIVQRTGKALPEGQAVSFLHPDREADMHALDRAENEARDAMARVDHGGHEPVTSVEDRLAMIGIDAGGAWKAILGEWGIDMRDPTIDRRLVEFSLRVPVDRLIADGKTRAILSRVLEGRVAPATIAARQTGHQAADWADAMQEARAVIADEIERIEMSDDMCNLIDIERMKRVMAAWPEPGAAEWRSTEMEVLACAGILRTIAAAGHMRKAKGSNY